MSSSSIVNVKEIIAIKGLELSCIVFKNGSSAITAASVNPSLPLGLCLSIENQISCVLCGTPLQVSACTVYAITIRDSSDHRSVSIEITVIEAPIKTQRGEIIAVNDARHDLDTPRSQIENRLSDALIMESRIKPHEKFEQQPTGDDNRLSQQTENNPEADKRAEKSPELIPSPSAQLQQQAIAKATLNITPSPTR